MKFRFGDSVVVNSGFFKGLVGKTLSIVTDASKPSERIYEVSFSNEGPASTVYFFESELDPGKPKEGNTK